MSDDLVLYGARGSGAVAVEAALVLIGRPFTLIDAYTWSGPDEQAKVAGVNPMRQVPTLVLPNPTASRSGAPLASQATPRAGGLGEAITESAAILIWLAETHPMAGLAPRPGDPWRAQFLRWMSFVSASIYSLYWVKDDPSRLTATKAAEAVLVERTLDRIAECWGIMDAQVQPRPYILGETLSVLDLYVAVVSRFKPRRRRFYEVAPKMAQAVRAVDADPRLAKLWAARMPFEEGWEG